MLNSITWEGVWWLLFASTPFITLLGLGIAAVVWEIKCSKPKPKAAQPAPASDA